MRSLQTPTAFATPFTAPSARSEPPRPAEPGAGKREWSISEMAHDFGLTLRALRFYEAKGMIAPQRFGGARYYSARDRARVSLILTAKRMGFTLSEAAAMIGDASEPGREALPLSPETVAAQIDFLESQRGAIETALASLRGRLDTMAP